VVSRWSKGALLGPAFRRMQSQCAESARMKRLGSMVVARIFKIQCWRCFNSWARLVRVIRNSYYLYTRLVSRSSCSIFRLWASKCFARPLVHSGVSAWSRITRSLLTKACAHHARFLLRQASSLASNMRRSKHSESTALIMIHWRQTILLGLRKRFNVVPFALIRRKLRATAKGTMRAWAHRRINRVQKRRKCKRACEHYSCACLRRIMGAWTLFVLTARQRRHGKMLLMAKKVSCDSLLLMARNISFDSFISHVFCDSVKRSSQFKFLCSRSQDIERTEKLLICAARCRAALLHMITQPDFRS
jgi:hypothetical protein